MFQINRRARRGMAVLEFAMSFPLLALMIMFMIWIGDVFATQSRVCISVRNEAWRARHVETSSRPLQFGGAGTITRQGTESVGIKLPLGDLPTPNSSHVVLGGSWDYRQLPLGPSPNWKELALAAGDSASVLAAIRGIDSGRFEPDQATPKVMTDLKNSKGRIDDEIERLDGLYREAKRLLDWF